MSDVFTFSKLDVGDKFTIKEFPADASGRPIVFTKASAVHATDSDGQAWDFTKSQYLHLFKR